MGRPEPKAASETIPQTGYKTIFSSRGARWGGLAIEAGRQFEPEQPFTFETSEPRLYSVLGATRISWSARGERHNGLWRPGTTIFIKDGYRLDNLFTQDSLSIFVELEKEKICELWHDDARPSSEGLLDHVIGVDERAFGLLNAMIADARAGNPAGDLFSQSISVAVLAHVFEQYDRLRSIQRHVGCLSQRQMDSIRNYVRDHVGDDLSITTLAGLLKMSSAYFCKAFSKSFGVTPHRFILNERIAVARQRLQNPSAPSLALLASVLGFADQAHFSNVFRKFVGCSPSAYRRRFKS